MIKPEKVFDFSEALELDQGTSDVERVQNLPQKVTRITKILRRLGFKPEEYDGLVSGVLFVGHK